MKIRALLLALLLCLGLLPAAPSLHAETAKRKKKTVQTSSASHRKARSTAASAKTRSKAASARISPKTKAPIKRRVIPATTTAEDEDTRPVETVVIDPNRPPQVYAQAVMVLNARTGEVLYERNADAPRQIASTTKLMTALLVAEAGNLNQEVEVQPVDTVCEPTKLYFKPGERYARSALLYALLVHSCNDVARALARDNAGSIPDFADKMNARAAQMGTRDTHFVNPNGLPSPGEDQHSTARDLSRIARVAYANQILRPIMATVHLDFRMANGQIRTYSNTNKVLQRFPFCNGMKTGYTDAAGHCLVSSADDNNNAIISVCLGDSRAIWNDSQKLLAWGLGVAKARANAQAVPAATGALPTGLNRDVAEVSNSVPAWTTPSKVN